MTTPGPGPRRVSFDGDEKDCTAMKFRPPSYGDIIQKKNAKMKIDTTDYFNFLNTHDFEYHDTGYELYSIQTFQAVNNYIDPDVNPEGWEVSFTSVPRKMWNTVRGNREQSIEILKLQIHVEDSELFDHVSVETRYRLVGSSGTILKFKKGDQIVHETHPTDERFIILHHKNDVLEPNIKMFIYFHIGLHQKQQFLTVLTNVLNGQNLFSGIKESGTGCNSGHKTDIGGDESKKPKKSIFAKFSIGKPKRIDPK